MYPRSFAILQYMKLRDLPPHHAILLTTASRETLTDSLWKELEAESPSHRLFNQTVLDIEKAREIISWAKTPSEQKYGLISFHTAGVPAQNALLKILEEPPLHTKFILVTSNKDALIDTVVSRVHHIATSSTSSDKNEALTFLKTAPHERMSLPYITALLERKDEEERKDREAVRGFVLSIGEALSEKNAKGRFVEETLTFASYASDPSASGKAILEYLALLLPQVR